MPSLKAAAIARAGHEYQDLIGIQQLIDLYRNRSKYLWMQLESEDAQMGYLDDVVAAHADGKFDVTQVKFTADSTAHFLDWDWLLAKKPKGTSLLKKWSSTVNGFTLGPINIACLQTNRLPDADFSSTLDADGRVDFDGLDAKRRAAVEAEIGNAFVARRFFKVFQFLHSKPMMDALEDDLRSSIVPTDTDIVGWMNLRAQAKRWAMNKNAPEPDGRIIHKHLTQIITRKAPRPMPQNFAVPVGYAVPNRRFHDDFLKRVCSGQKISVLWGTPGRGKSTYLSFLTSALRRAGVPTIRHHYFLSLNDRTTDRFSFVEIARSLMDQIVAHYPEAIRGKGLEGQANEPPSQLPKWLEVCGEHFAVSGNPFIVMIDGLDHVWRERRNLDHLNHLFENLIPCAPNVCIIVGTQKISDDKLPPRLLRGTTKKDWWQIPPMEELSVQIWVRRQHVAGRLRLTKNRRYDQTVLQQVGAIGKVFFEISRGHPLHLIYSFEALVRTGGFVDEDAVRLLPICPDGDINKYYALLWARLSKEAREIIHVVAGADFHWPLGGIVRYFGQVDEVDFLLEHRRIGLVPFHGSILAFVREMADHDAVFKALLPRVLKWLKKDAPPYWNWGWLWLMQARSGDSRPLLRGANRAWAVDSIAAGWPLDQMIEILKVAERNTFDSHDYAKTLELRLLKTRISNADNYQTSDYGRVVECALVASRNIQMLDVIADGLTTLDENVVVMLARAANSLKPEVCEEARRELGHRVNLWLNLRHRPEQEFLELAKAFLETASFCQVVATKDIVSFIERFSDGTAMFEYYLESLVSARRIDALAETYASLKGTKSLGWKNDTLDALLRSGVAESVDIGPTVRSLEIEGLTPFASCWLHYHNIPQTLPVEAPARPIQLSDRNPRYRQNFTAEHYLYDLFFCELSAGLTKPKATPAVYPKSNEFIDQAINLVVDCARNIAAGRSQLSFSTLYYAATAIAPIGDQDLNAPSHSQYFGFRTAMLRISVDVHLIKQPTGKFSCLSDAELAVAMASKHWVEDVWLEEQLRRNLPILSATQARASLAAEIGYLDKHVTPFNERADKWTLLSRFAILYQLAELESVVRRAADCVLGYGWRKDLWMNDVLDAVAEVHTHGAAQGLPMLRQLVPIVERITEFTDGDETNHVRSELIEAVARVTPARLPNFYEHHLENDDFRYAEEALEQHVRIANLESPITQALVHTFVEDRDITVLTDLATGSTKAAKLLTDQITFLGGRPPKKAEYGSNSPDYARSGKPPKVEKYGPAEFAKLLKRVGDIKLGYEHRREALRDWLRHWEKQGKARISLKSIKDYFEEEDRTPDADTILDDAFAVSKRVEGKKAAFYWLVKAHIHRNGWQSYWTSEAEILTRLKHSAEFYKADWQTFISETSVPAKYWQRRNYSFSIGLRYLVRFLLMVDQKQAAVDVTRAMIRTVIDEVSDQPIPGCPWFN